MSTPADGIIRLVRTMGIECVLDVGANIGQFGQALIGQGFCGRLISFEPLTESFEGLKEASKLYENWHCHNVALGERDGEETINISENRVSSSILPAKDWSILEHGPIACVARETVQVRRLDSLWSELPLPEAPAPLMLKIDVQGFEPQVIAGLGEKLKDIDLLLFEASLISVYEGEKTFECLVADMRKRAMHPVWIGAGWQSEYTGQIFQCDIAFAHHPLVSTKI